MDEQTKITTVEKVKDPRRVAQGKRLAAISREAKARKKQERLEQQQQQEGESGNLSYLLPVVIVGGIIATVGCYCYSKKKEEEPNEKEEEQSNTINRPSRIENF